MRLIYTPEGGDRQVFDYEADKLLSPDSEAIEEAGGPTWDSYAGFANRLFNDNMKARRALLWIMLRRQDPKLQFADVVIRVDEVKMAFDVDDYRKLLDRELTDEERGDVHAALAELFPDEAAVQPVGKDELDAIDTGSPSPTPDSEPSPNNSAGT